jgi:NAD(P)-dependent dehydrogenase (short-subunit alcohol dehydrogenase family)
MAKLNLSKADREGRMRARNKSFARLFLALSSKATLSWFTFHLSPLTSHLSPLTSHLSPLTYGSKAGAALSHYGASKAALEYLTRCWALELAPMRIRVNAVAVGPTQTGALEGMMGLSTEQAEAVKRQERERIPLGRRGHPNDVSRWIISLADPAADWITGQVLAVDGGLGLV